MAKVLGVGGIFFFCDDPKALAAWYQEHLALPIDPSYDGCALLASDMPEGAYTVWAPFKQGSDYFKPSSKEFMMNLVVDDLAAALEQVKRGGAELIAEPESFDYGDFGWFMDPAGNKIELWQPKLEASS